MLAPWVWSLTTLFFILGIKIYHPSKAILPSLLITWVTSVLMVSLVLFIDSLLIGSGTYSWEPMVLSIGLFLFCFPLYLKFLQVKESHKKEVKKQRKAQAS